MKIFGAVILTASVAGCAELKPVSIPVEIEHISHLTQHAPFTSNPTNHGANVVSAGLKWRVNGVTIQVMEGYSPDPIDGLHELFTAKAAYEIPLR